MTEHSVGTREEWLKARTEPLAAEKEHTRRGDELTKRRLELPWVRIDKDYRFETTDGPASLSDLFRGRSQLLVHHFMFPGCPSCSSMADGYEGFAIHPFHHDVGMVRVSRYPIDELAACSNGSTALRSDATNRAAGTACTTSTTTTSSNRDGARPRWPVPGRGNAHCPRPLLAVVGGSWMAAVRTRMASTRRPWRGLGPQQISETRLAATAEVRRRGRS